MSDCSLNQTAEWVFYEKESDTRYPINIPGSVISGMLENNLIEDPYYRMNEYPVRELMNRDYVFEGAFSWKRTPGKTYELVMEGIDTVAAVYINNVKLCETSNMHLTYTVNAGDCLKDGINIIRIEFTSPVRYISEHIPADGKEVHFINTGTMKDSQYIRKASSMFGWDWGPQLPDMGIWRDIYIREYETARIDYLSIEQVHNADQSLAELKIAANIHDVKQNEILVDITNKEYSLKVTVINPSGEVIIEDRNISDGIIISNPQFWWPNRLGDHPLYEVTVSLYAGLHKIDSKTEKIGIRTLTVSQDKDEWGSEFCFMINGVKIFSKGADYIPEDAIYSNISHETISELIDDCVIAGFNTIRVWGGGYYPSDDFYDLCDRAGIIVWQDFMFACNVYELWDEFEVNITKEAIQNVRRLRNHASLGLLCGNNELESAWVGWGGYRDHSDALKADYLVIFEQILPGVVSAEAPSVFYWPSSPSSGGNFDRPDDDNRGDRHYWDVWHGEKPFTDYERYFFRYCSEFGFQSFPEISTVRKFAKEGDLNIFSPVMESHQKNGTANSKILNYISANFLYPKDFESLIYVSQVLQGMAIKYGVEHFRRNRGRCMGTLYWQLNDNWPVASWASIDYYGRWKALHYMAADFYADICGSVKRDGNIFTPYVQNETFEASVSNVTILLKNVCNQVIASWTDVISCEKFGVAKGNSVDITSNIAGHESELYFEAVFTHSNGTVSHQVEPVLKYKAMELPDTKVYITTRTIDEHTVEATVKADKFAAFVDLICDEVNIIWEKNFFFITDSNEIKITGRTKDRMDICPEIRVMTISDTYTR